VHGRHRDRPDVRPAEAVVYLRGRKLTATAAPVTAAPVPAAAGA